MPRGASSSMALGKILQTNPTTATYPNVTLVDKWFFYSPHKTQHTVRRLCRCQLIFTIRCNVWGV